MSHTGVVVDDENRIHFVTIDQPDDSTPKTNSCSHGCASCAHNKQGSATAVEPTPAEPEPSVVDKIGNIGLCWKAGRK